MRPFTSTIPLDEARRRLDANVRPIERTERISLRDASGRVAGAEITPGDVVVRAGDVLNPSRLGAVAAIGCAELDVYVRPRVAILSTGNEVVEPGKPLRPGQIYDVNRFTLAAVAAAHGCVPKA